MFPPAWASFSFRGDPAGGDEAVAARVSALATPGNVIVVGAARPGLLVALARHRAHVTCVDPSRGRLAAAKRILTEAGLEERTTLFAADPRDLDVPGGGQLGVVTSLVFRAVANEEGRSQMLTCLAKALAGGGRLCLDVEGLPDPVPDEGRRERLLLAEGNGRWSWSRGPGNEVVTVHCESATDPESHLELSSVPLAGVVEEVRRAGFDVETACDAETGTVLDDSTQRLWLVARSGRASRP